MTMKNMTLENVAAACGSSLCNGEKKTNIVINGVQLDSRKIKDGNLFIATKGERVDGHSFIATVKDMGAVCVVCEKIPEDVDIPYILVEDSFQALKDIATFYRQQLTIPIVGVTGSVGKTSTKEAIAAVLSAKYNVQKTAGNFNNEVGLPLTILSINDEHEAAVVEMGISDFGEMDRLSAIARPDVCVITNIGLCHLENLKSQEGILKAKTEIFNHRNKEGAVILNGDDPLLNSIKDVDGVVPKKFGKALDCNVRIDDVIMHGLFGSDFTLKTLTGRILPCHSDLPGNHVIINAACAALVGHELGLSDGEIKQGIVSQESVAGRSNIINVNGYSIIDDCYNANPVSMNEALDLLSMADTRKVAVLGDMFELGSNEELLHESVGEYAATKDIDVLIVAGKLGKSIYSAAKDINSDMECHYYEDRDKLIDELDNIIKKGDSILVKASHGMQYNEIVNHLTKGTV